MHKTAMEMIANVTDNIIYRKYKKKKKNSKKVSGFDVKSSATTVVQYDTVHTCLVINICEM